MAEQPEIADPTQPSGAEQLQTRHILEDLHRDVAVAAYYRAESRGFAPGHELEDWIEAERRISARRPGAR